MTNINFPLFPKHIFIISVLFTATEIWKWLNFLTFIASSKIIFRESQEWGIFLNNIFVIQSNEKFKTSYLNFHKAYNSQTWQVGDLGWGVPLTKSHILLTMWSRDTTKENKNITSPFRQDLQASNFEQWCLKVSCSYWKSHMSHWSSGQMMSRCKTTTLYPICHQIR